MKNIEIPKGVRIVISFLDLPDGEVVKIKERLKSDESTGTLLTNLKLKVIAQNDYTIVLEATSE